MKKIVAIIMVLAMVMCGTAFASVQDNVSETLGVECIFLGNYSILGSILDDEMPDRMACAVVFDDGGWYLEYRNTAGQYYGWESDEDDASMLSIAMGAMYEVREVDACILLMGGNTFTLTYADLGEGYYTTAEDFVIAIAANMYGLT